MRHKKEEDKGSTAVAPQRKAAAEGRGTQTAMR
jgi:hypothetical protein